jgi:subtilisin family serine protease
MGILELVGLPALMAVTSGRRGVAVALLDGPVVIDHPDLTGQNIRGIPGGVSSGCAEASSSACQHGTFVAGILSARRGSSAPGICPDCSVLVRPIFSEAAAKDELPSATPQQLATAIGECIDAGAWVVNLSAAMGQPSTRAEPELHDALDYAARQGMIVVAAAGNQGMLGSSAITRHRWVVPVVGYGVDGRPMAQSNLGRSMGRHGLGAPGEYVTSLSSTGSTVALTLIPEV